MVSINRKNLQSTALTVSITVFVVVVVAVDVAAVLTV